MFTTTYWVCGVCVCVCVCVCVRECACVCVCACKRYWKRDNNINLLLHSRFFFSVSSVIGNQETAWQHCLSWQKNKCCKAGRTEDSARFWMSRLHIMSWHSSNWPASPGLQIWDACHCRHAPHLEKSQTHRPSWCSHSLSVGRYIAYWGIILLQKK